MTPHSSVIPARALCNRPIKTNTTQMYNIILTYNKSYVCIHTSLDAYIYETLLLYVAIYGIQLINIDINCISEHTSDPVFDIINTVSLT